MANFNQQQQTGEEPWELQEESGPDTTPKNYGRLARSVCALVTAAIASAIVPDAAEAKSPIKGLVKIDGADNPLAYQPQTYFVPNSVSRIETKSNQPALFQITETTPITFYVTGPATVSLEFHSIAHKHQEMPYKANITVDQEKFAIPHPSPSKIKTGSITIGAGTHAIEVKPIDPHSFYVSLAGAQETAFPAIPPAPYVPFEADPDLKPVIEIPCVFKLDPKHDQGYEDLEVIHHPTTDEYDELKLGRIDEYKELKVAGMPATTYRVSNSPLIISYADNGKSAGTTDAMRYELPKPIYPIEERLCTYVLTMPRVHAIDYSGPYTMPLDATVTYDANAGYTATVDKKPEGLTCQTHNVVDKTSKLITRALLYCWDKKGDVHGTTLFITDPSWRKKSLHYTLERQ